MNEQVQKRVVVAKEKWQGLSKDQKLKLTIASIVLLTSLIAFIYISIRPTMVPLIGDLTYTDLGQVQGVLDDNGVKYVVDDTTVFVEDKDLTSAKVYLATTNVPSSNVGYSYADAFANSGMSATDSVKRESFKQAKESEIEQSLEMLDGVNSAVVTVNIPESTNYFISDEVPPTAAAVLETNREITKSEGVTMARLIAMSVEGLTLDNIEITDQNSSSIYSGQEDNSSIAVASDAYEQEIIREKAIEEGVEKTLSPLYTDVFVTPNVVMNWDETVQSSTEYVSPDSEATNTGYIDSTTSDKSSYENTIPNEVPGTDTNGQSTSYQSVGDENSTASTNKNQTNYKYNEYATQTVKQVGTIDQAQSSIAVTVYNNKIYDEKTLREAGAYEGMTWEQYKDTILPTPITVDESIVANIQAGTGIQNVSVIGYEVPTFIDEQVTPLDVRQLIMFIVLALLILLLAIGLIRNTQKEEITEVEPELSVEDLLLSTQLEEEKEIQRLKEIEYNAENETKKQIDKFVKEKPDAVAQLLRNWLSEDWE